MNVLYESAGSIARITLNRPESLNAVSAQLGSDLTAALKKAAGDASVRVIVLDGAGRGFCSGGDLKAMAGGISSAAGQTEQLGAILRNFHEVIRALYGMEIPVVAALHGPVVGAGMSIALCCDIRIAADDATFCQAFIRLGLTPDGGSSWLLPRAAGAARAAQLMMTADTIDARRALEWGLVSQVVAAGQHVSSAMELARRIAGYSGSAMRGLKRLIRVSEQNSFPTQMDAEVDAQVANAATPEFRAALAEFVAR